MNFIKDFTERGYFYQCTDTEALTDIVGKQKIAAYVGFDCTAKSLHVGNLMQIMIMRLFQQHGHKPIILIGGATTKIGDPTGKEEARKYLDDNIIAENMAGIKRSLEKFIKFGDGPSDAIMVNNSTWLESIKYIDFLRDYGRVFSVNRMLSMESVKARLDREQSLTFLEFNYMLLQAFDFLHLNNTYNCMIQFGGSDQWGNIVTGTDLIRKITGKEAYGLTTPLLTTSSGVKMGKSLGGAVWINEDMLSPYEYYQYWRNTEDADVLRFAKLYCEFDAAELSNFTVLVGSDINEAKKKLAYRVTELCHGKEKAVAAFNTSVQVFEQGGIAGDLPTIFVTNIELQEGIDFAELFMRSGLTNTKSEARRLAQGGGARINDEVVDNDNLLVKNDMLKDGVIKISCGKKKHILVKVRD